VNPGTLVSGVVLDLLMELLLRSHSEFYTELGATEKVKFTLDDLDSLDSGVIFFSGFLNALHNQCLNHPIGLRQSEVFHFSGSSVLGSSTQSLTS
jgi:hypothetical protein